MSKSNYYVASFFWSTFAKVIYAVIGFVTVPLLLGLWGQTTYGLLSLATACNGYVQLLDLGMNTGAVKFFSQWKQEGKDDLLYRVAHSNVVFYLFIAIINIIIICSIAIFGETIFNISHEQFQIFRLCLFIIAIYSIPTWITTAYNQLLVANMEMAFTQRWYVVMYIMRALLVVVTVRFKLSLPVYYFFFLMLTAFLVIPYMIRCRIKNYIDGFQLQFCWNDFKLVLMYSLAIFALSLFQTTASQSRPLILGVFAEKAADAVAEYRIIEMIPNFIIAVGGALSGIFLPKTSKLIAKGNHKEIEDFAYNGTLITSVLTNVICVPFIIGANEVITAYVGKPYLYLVPWLRLWCITALIQIHTTPGNAIVLAFGKTKLLVVVTACSCIFSMVINATMCKQVGMGSAVIGYLIYVLIVIGSYYFYHYKYLLGLNRAMMIKGFIIPTVVSALATVPFLFGVVEKIKLEIGNERIEGIIRFIIITVIWELLYFTLLWLLRVLRIKDGKPQIHFMDLRKREKYDNM